MEREAVAILQFLQNRTKFGSKNHFTVEVHGKGKTPIGGGVVSRIQLYELGAVTIRADIDGFTSPWIKVPVGAGDIINLIILPPKTAHDRAARLSRPDDYLTIEEVSRA